MRNNCKGAGIQYINQLPHALRAGRHIRNGHKLHPSHNNTPDGTDPFGIFYFTNEAILIRKRMRVKLRFNKKINTDMIVGTRCPRFAEDGSSALLKSTGLPYQRPVRPFNSITAVVAWWRDYKQPSHGVARSCVEIIDLPSRPASLHDHAKGAVIHRIQIVTVSAAVRKPARDRGSCSGQRYQSGCVYVASHYQPVAARELEPAVRGCNASLVRSFGRRGLRCGQSPFQSRHHRPSHPSRRHPSPTSNG